ncbi:MAG: InlB B-repeat-containing protein [Sphaerochaeta sp.]|nr:InlB B-repeat-containing protein [Sphaerochaeta sp.]
MKKHMHKNISMLLLVLVSILFVFVGCSDMMAMAALVEKSYTVTFDSQAATTDPDSTIKTVTSPATTIDGLPTAPEKTGYIFDGWFTEGSGGGTEFTASTEVPRNITVYAKWRLPTTGDIGPAGGYIFYDKGTFSDGWRYLEAAPSDIMLGASDNKHIFGYYRTAVDGPSVLIGTATGIGTGKANTAALVGAMKETAYTTNDSNITTTTGEYAARLCYIHKVGEYEDWFLPSKDELNLMYLNLKKTNVGGFSDLSYSSSSEAFAHLAKLQFFGTGAQLSYSRDGEIRVRPVRAF